MTNLWVDPEWSRKFAITWHTGPVQRLSDSYTQPQFRALIERENDRVELKTGTGNVPLQESLVALSNADGGIVFIGVANTREVVGRRLDQGTEDAIHQAARDAHSVGRYHIRQISVAGVHVVAVEVQRREEGFAQTSSGRLLIRRGGHNIALIGSDAWDFMSQRALRRFESSDSRVPVSAADPGYFGELRQAYGWSNGAADMNDRLRERGLATQSDTLTMAGALLLTDPNKSLGLAKMEVEVRRYQDDGPDYDRRLSFSGPLHRQVRDTTEFVVGELGSDLVVAGLYRYNLPRLPQVVVRETLANAVAHRSYELDRSSVLVEIRPDRVIVTSPGRLPEPVTVETMRQAQAARNPSIIDVLRRFSLAEDAGRGVDVIEDAMEEALLDPPRFVEDGASVMVILPLRGPITPRERGWIADLERRGQLQITDRLLLVHAARGERLTNGRAREILNIDSTAARQALQRLRDSRLLVQQGERGGATYTLAESIAPPAAYRMTPRQLRSLVLEAATDGPVSNETVREITGLDRQDALRLLQDLVGQGALVQIGERRGTRYRLPG